MSKHISLASYELEAAARAEGYAHVWARTRRARVL